MTAIFQIRRASLILPVIVIYCLSLTCSFAGEPAGVDASLLRNRIYNGDFSLGNIGFAVKRVLDGEKPPSERYTSFTVEKKTTTGYGNVFKVNPVENCLAWTLSSKDTYLTTGGKRLKCDVFIEANAKPLKLWLGVREAYGKKRIQVLGKSVRITPGQWNHLKIPFTVMRSGFFTIESLWVAESIKGSASFQKPDRILSERKDGNYQVISVLFDNFSILNKQPKDLQENNHVSFDIAIHTDKVPPIYGLGDNITLTFSAKTSSGSTFSAENRLVCRISQDESTNRYKDYVVTLKASSEGILVGTITFEALRYGAFSVTPESLNGKPLRAVTMGGDFVVIHKLSVRTDTRTHDLRSRIQTAQVLRQVKHGVFARSRHTLQLNYADPATLLETIEKLGVGEIRAQGFVDWRTVERQQGVFRFAGHVAWAKAFAKRGIRLQASLGGQCFGSQTLPDFVNKTSALASYPQKHEAHLPPLTLWEKYVEACIDALHEYMPIWEIHGEPQWGLTAEEYAPYLKSAYTLIKKKAPELKVIGFGLTGDGQNLLGGFARKGIKLGLTKFMDGVAFHPYGAGLDYDKFGDPMAFTTLLTDLKKMYQPSHLSLHDTELYYVVNTPPGMSSLIGGHLFTSADLQRHVLIGLGNGLEQVSASTIDSYFKNRILTHFKHIPKVTRMQIIPNARYVAINYLAKLLEKLYHTENLGESNPLFHRYLFSDKTANKNNDSRQSVGVIWYSAPMEQMLVIPQHEDVSFYDHFGNPISIDKKTNEVTLGLTPVYLKANDQSLRKLFKNLSVKVVDKKKPITWKTIKQWDITSMGMKIPSDIRLYCNNKSGLDMTIEIVPNKRDATNRQAIRIKCNQASIRQNQNDGQLTFFYQGILTKGKRYRISFWAKASSEMKIFSTARLNQKPWSRLGAGAQKGFYITKNWQHFTYEFIANLNGVKGIRAPGIRVGNFDDGMALWLSMVTFEQEQ